MNIKQKLKEIAVDFDLNFAPKDKFKMLVLTRRDIVIRVFLCGCPDPIMVKHGSKQKEKISENLVRYLKTEDYRKEANGLQGCVISKEALKEELKLIDKIPDEKIKKEVEGIYSKIKKKIGKSDRLSLISDCKKEESEQRDEIILHEFIHELLENNEISPKSWKWNEGLVTYITNRAIGKLYRFEKSELEQHPMWKIYANYTRKWMKILEDKESPEERKKSILDKIRRLDE